MWVLTAKNRLVNLDNVAEIGPSAGPAPALVAMENRPGTVCRDWFICDNAHAAAVTQGIAEALNNAERLFDVPAFIAPQAKAKS